MSEREKDVIARLSDSLRQLDEKKQNYILGVTEGMVLARETTRESNVCKNDSN